MDQNLARFGEWLQHADHAAFAALRQMPHVARALLGDAEADQFVIGPAGAVYQKAVGIFQKGFEMRFEFTEARRVKQVLACAQVFDAYADIVAFLRILAMRRIRRRLA